MESVQAVYKERRIYESVPFVWTNNYNGVHMDKASFLL
jgi:hypothetical protein